MMGDVMRLVEGLYQAALVSQSPQSTPSQISQAVQFVEQVKTQDVHSVLQAASQLAQPQQPLEVQVAGLSLLHQQVQARWKQMNAEAQAALGTIANSIVAAAATSNSAWVVKGKAAQLLASVSGHQGPDAFNTLTNQLLAVGPEGPAVQVELACLVLRYVSEDTTHFDEGSTKKPLLSAIMASSSAVMQFAVQVLQHHTSLAFQLRAQGNQTAAQHSMGAVAAAFGVVSSYMDWTPLKAVASSELVTILMRFMDVDEFRMSAMDILKQLISRRQIPDSEDIYVPLMDNVATALITIAGAILKPEFLKALDYTGPLEEFGIRLCSTMTTFAELHFRCVSKTEDKLMFIRQMLKFVEHPYLRLAAQALQFWQQYLTKLNPPQHATNAPPPPAAPPAPTNGDASTKKGTSRGTTPPKPAYLIPYDPPDDVWNELAFAMTGHMMNVVLVPDIEVEPPDYFETAQEHREFCASFRGQVKVIMRGTAGRAPHHTLQCTTQFLHFCLERSGPEQPKEKLLAHLEAAVFCLEAVMGTLMEHPDKQQLLSGVSQLMQTLMQYRNPGPAAILLQTRGLEAFAKPLEHLPHMAMPLLESMFNLLQSIPLSRNGQLPPPADLSPAMKEANMARLTCSKLLLGLARAAPTALSPHLQTIAQRTEALWQEGKLQEGERVQLYEGLLCASGALGTESQQLVLEWMLKPLHAIWTSQEWQAQFASAQDFAKCFLPWQVDARGTSVGARELRWAVYHQVALIERCMRRSNESPPLEDGQTTPPPNPWNSHLEWVLIPVLQMIACLHGLWTPDIRAVLQPIKGALDMDVREKAVRLKADMAEVKKEFEAVGVAGANEAGARTWLQGVRDMCYMIVYGASAHCPAFWLCQPVAAFVHTTLLAHLEYIEHRHLRNILRHIMAFWVVRCPQHLRPQWLGPLLNTLIPHLHQRLTEGWKQLASATSAPSASEEQLSEERLQDSLVRDISKEYMEMLWKTGRRTDKPDTDQGVTTQDTGTCFDYLLEANQQLALLTVATATEALSWPDSEIAKRALMFLRLVIPKLGLRVPGIDVAAGMMLRAVILALANPLYSTQQAELLSFARLICLTYMQHTPHIRQQFQALPGISPQAVSEFEAAFFATTVEKSQRDLVKMLLINAGDESLRSLLMLHGQPGSTKTSLSQVPKADANNRGSNTGDSMFGF